VHVGDLLLDGIDLNLNDGGPLFDKGLQYQLIKTKPPAQGMQNRYFVFTYESICHGDGHDVVQAL
jgi:hypothetical protein